MERAYTFFYENAKASSSTRPLAIESDFLRPLLKIDAQAIADLSAGIGQSCICETERMTEGPYNLLAIPVASDHPRSGAGRALLRHVESVLRQGDARLLLMETATDPEQDRAGAFYTKEGFAEGARIRDFYAPGQIKVVFWKQL